MNWLAPLADLIKALVSSASLWLAASWGADRTRKHQLETITRTQHARLDIAMRARSGRDALLERMRQR